MDDGGVVFPQAAQRKTAFELNGVFLLSPGMLKTAFQTLGEEAWGEAGVGGDQKLNLLSGNAVASVSNTLGGPRVKQFRRLRKGRAGGVFHPASPPVIDACLEHDVSLNIAPPGASPEVAE